MTRFPNVDLYFEYRFAGKATSEIRTPDLCFTKALLYH